jgi:hypothetical protein
VDEPWVFDLILLGFVALSPAARIATDLLGDLAQAVPSLHHIESLLFLPGLWILLFLFLGLFHPFRLWCSLLHRLLLVSAKLVVLGPEFVSCLTLLRSRRLWRCLRFLGLAFSLTAHPVKLLLKVIRGHSGFPPLVS